MSLLMDSACTDDLFKNMGKRTISSETRQSLEWTSVSKRDLSLKNFNAADRHFHSCRRRLAQLKLALLDGG